MGKYEWLFYVALAGLAWGTYVPLIFFGGSELGGKSPLGGRLMAILCVGVAYFVLAVVIPLALFLTRQTEWPDIKTTGLVFSSLAGVAGAAGAICVIFASKAAMESGLAIKKDNPAFNPATFRMYIGPLIFGLAPVINTLVSLIWHPQKGEAFHFGIEVMPGWKLWLGIILVGLGAALVLFAKEEAEAKPKHAAPKPAPSAVASLPGSPAIQERRP